MIRFNLDIDLKDREFLKFLKTKYAIVRSGLVIAASLFAHHDARRSAVGS